MGVSTSVLLVYLEELEVVNGEYSTLMCCLIDTGLGLETEKEASLFVYLALL